MKKFDAVIAGYACVDLIPDFKKEEVFTNISDVLRPGKLIEINGLNFLIGGIVANTGLAMAKFNKRVFLNGLVGEDFMGKIAIDWLGKYNLSEGIQTTTDEGTAFSIVLAPPGIDRIFLESIGCNKIFDASHINFDAIAQCRLFHFGYPPLLKQFFINSGSLLVDLFSEIQNMGVVTSLDFSLPDSESESGKVNWPEILSNVLPVTDIFVPSLEEALQIMLPVKHAELQLICDNGEIIDHVSIDLIRVLGKKIIDSGVKILLIKAGHRGAYLLTGDISEMNSKRGLNLCEKNWSFRELWCKAYPTNQIDIVNSTGAGDTAAAAFLSAILDGNDAESALKYAALAGRNNLYCRNIYEELPGWQEMGFELETYGNTEILMNLQLLEI